MEWVTSSSCTDKICLCTWGQVWWAQNRVGGEGTGRTQNTLFLAGAFSLGYHDRQSQLNLQGRSWEWRIREENALLFLLRGTLIKSIPPWESLNMSPKASLDNLALRPCVHFEFYPMPGLSHFDLPSCITLTSGFSLPSGQEMVIFCLTKMLIEPCRWAFRELWLQGKCLCFLFVSELCWCKSKKMN